MQIKRRKKQVEIKFIHVYDVFELKEMEFKLKDVYIEGQCNR